MQFKIIIYKTYRVLQNYFNFINKSISYLSSLVCVKNNNLEVYCFEKYLLLSTFTHIFALLIISLFILLEKSEANNIKPNQVYNIHYIANPNIISKCNQNSNLDPENKMVDKPIKLQNTLPKNELNQSVKKIPEGNKATNYESIKKSNTNKKMLKTNSKPNKKLESSNKKNNKTGNSITNATGNNRNNLKDNPTASNNNSNNQTTSQARCNLNSFVAKFDEIGYNISDQVAASNLAINNNNLEHLSNLKKIEFAVDKELELDNTCKTVITKDSFQNNINTDNQIYKQSDIVSNNGNSNCNYNEKCNNQNSTTKYSSSGNFSVEVDEISGSDQTLVSMPQIISKVIPTYPEWARKQGISGKVTYKLLIEPSGTVKDVSIVQTTVTPRLASLGLQALRQWVFSPVIINGNAQETSVLITLQFKLY